MTLHEIATYNMNANPGMMWRRLFAEDALIIHVRVSWWGKDYYPFVLIPDEAPDMDPTYENGQKWHFMQEEFDSAKFHDPE